MKILPLSAALIAASFAIAPVAQARPHAAKTMAVTLEGGKTVTFKMVKMHGQMMAVIPVEELRDVVHRTDRTYGQ